ncbi:MAG TPA: HAD family phosphatase [Phototrophicaceae bacterium]|nr:HAD family phosphatase [Phototrophicaceae bacterium]
MKRAVIFDYGGVLMKTVDYTPRHTWDERLHLERGSVERAVHGSQSWLNVMTGHITLADYWADVAHQLSLDEANTCQLAQDFYSGDQLDLDLIAYIRQLRERGHMIALLSNASPALRGELDQLGITSLFEPLVVSCEIGVLKPEARAYQAVLERIRRPSHEAIFIDDMPANIAGANAVGLHGLQYTAGMDLPAALEPLLYG